MVKKLWKLQNHGIPYQGSKTKVIDQIAKHFPNADNFYDLFGGGFSVTHYLMEYRAQSYKYFHYNELRSGICELIRDAIDGKYNYNVFKPDWITRERFMSEKKTNAYIQIIWSFGNNGRDYLFGKQIENEKRSMHQAVVFDEFDDFFIKTFKITKFTDGMSITEKRLHLKLLMRRLKRVELQQLEQLQRLTLTNLDYRDVEIRENSVLYCDIPYAGTGDYGSNFNHAIFFDWAASQTCPLFISEYEVKDDRFFLLKTISHRSTFASGHNNAVKERLYGNKIAYDIIQKKLGN